MDISTKTYIDLSEPIPLAPHFSWEELVYTVHRPFIVENRNVPVAFESRGVALAQMLERVRRRFNKPVFSHSAWRCAALNTAVGGKPDSQHMKFEACDFEVIGVDFAEVFNWIRHESGIPFGQVIEEGYDPPASISWIHLSLGEPYRDLLRSRQALQVSYKTQQTTRLS